MFTQKKPSKNKSNTQEFSKFPIEYLHLITGYTLVICGVLAYTLHGFEMLLSWIIFGCMYISMSDIGECSKCSHELCSFRHKNRRKIAYLGLTLSLILLLYYLTIILGIQI